MFNIIPLSRKKFYSNINEDYLHDVLWEQEKEWSFAVTVLEEILSRHIRQAIHI